ncbi:hypothetical protein [Peribacillus acanthi]|uniref:hypothetical protein n=1 Tax=Peribacillus acanthi TaxID=2171554 RepID=UPI000D3E88B3|nr:hypothetical protein [Peribacillus acanthi]
MTIPVDQLKMWAVKGSNKISSPAHNKLRAVVSNPDYSILSQKKVKFTTMLQGSYVNFTGIKDNSDVDLVIKLSNYIKSNIDLTPMYENINTPPYTFPTFKEDLFKTLINFYGKDKVLVDSKSIKVNIEEDFWADVVPAFQYYNCKFIDTELKVIKGIYLETENGEPIINYPNQHQANGQRKSNETNEVSRVMVRVFKNAKTYLVQNQIIDKKVAPSYFIENLIYNVPNEYFTNNLQETFLNILNYLNLANLETFKCQNEHDYIFGDKVWHWNTKDAHTFIKAVLELWESWR